LFIFDNQSTSQKPQNMNKTTLKLFLIATLFVNQIYAQIGTTCANPVLVTSIPYSTQDDTTNYLDLIDGNPGFSGCGTTGTYLNGNDVFYKITPTNANPLTISSQTNSTWSGLFIYNSCANIGVSCVIGTTSGNGTTLPDSVTFTPTIGQSYYVVLSSWAAPQTISYNLTITENTCTNMAASFAVVSNCTSGTDTFFVTANVTNMGSASTIAGTTIPVSTSQIVTSTGQIQFGPFANGTNVSVNLQNQQDANCFKNSTSLTQLFCPALNDLCSTAISVTCGSTITQTTVGATTTGAPTTTCGTTSGSGGVWYSYMGTGDIVTFSLCGSTFDTKIQLFTGSCGAFSCVTGNDDFCSTQSQVQIATITGTLYYVYVYGNGSAQGQFTLNTTCITPPPAPSNDNCENAIALNVNTNAQCTNVTSGSIYGATQSLQNNSCVGTADDDVWYSFLATQTEHIIKIQNIVGSTLDLNHSVYSSNSTTSPCNNLTQIYCSNPDFSILNGLVIGQVYYIRVYSAISTPLQTTTFDICIGELPTTSPNDECTTAITLAVNNGLDCNSTTNTYLWAATASAQANTCTTTVDDDIWYKFTAISTSHQINYSNLFGTSTLTSALYSGDCNSLNNLGCFTTNSNTYQNLIIGQDYYLRIYSTGTSSSQYVEFDICIITLNPINVSTSQTTLQLVENLLDNNPCVIISNITSSTGTNFGSVNGIGSFTNTNILLPVQSGLILSTGNVNSASGSNTSTLSDGIAAWFGDSELEQIILSGTGQTMSSHNASILEFDFTAQHELLSFNFLFASDEYGTFQCTYADAFAFVLTDLNTGLKSNLAVVPGTSDPVSVITIRDMQYNISCTSVNSFFFDKYNLASPTQYSTPINFNGQTKLLTASSAIIPNNPYHIKLVVADRGDNAYDSAVFIENGSFISGPIQCTENIEFLAFLDSNNNGIKDINEGFFTNGEFVYQVNNSGPFTNVISPLGRHKIYPNNNTDLHDVSYLVNSQYSSNVTSSIIYNDISIANSTSSNVYYFPISVTNPYSDVSVNVVGVTPPRPNFTYKNRVIYKNNGVSTTNGTIAFTKDANVTISSVSSASAVLTSAGFTLDYANLLPQETRFVDVIMSVPNIPVVNLGNVLTNSASITSSINDIDLLNNTSNLNQIVVGSYDPNDKMESHGETIDINTFTTDSYLYYTIRFQNTGSANAINIKIEDLLDAQLDPTTLRMISSSHNYTLLREGNQLTWSFVGINLPSILQNEELSQGFVSFKIKPNLGFAVNDMIPNTAEIYFDFNPAIITNTFQTTFVNPLSNQSFLLNAISIYPNPTKEILNINYGTSTIDIKSIEIHDLLGKVVYQTKSKTELINVSSLNSGIYLITISTENNGKIVKKLIKN
jgi:hypothetical protein